MDVMCQLHSSDILLLFIDILKTLDYIALSVMPEL